MSRNIVLIHGWSDESKSFKKLQLFLREKLSATTHVISLADWVSMDDDVTYRDLARAMQNAWEAYQLPTQPGSVDVVVHSTGALVTREWMTTFHRPDTVPIKRFLMLAPANFGSHLAHKGHSFLARAFKGWGSGFQTGKKILQGLELASEYTWALAERDLFVAEADRWYGRDRILATVLVGNTGYDGISSIANEDGSDGTVRISTANLNALRVSLTFTPGNPVPTFAEQRSRGDIAFAIQDRENHSTIAFKDKGPVNPKTADLILAALKVVDADFPEQTGHPFAWQRQLDAARTPGQKDPGYQNSVVFLHDDLGQDIDDYFFEFYRKLKGADNAFEKFFYESVVRHVHRYERRPALRALYLNIDAFRKITAEEKVDPLYLSVAASPEFSPPKQPVGYLSFGEGDLGRYAIKGNHLQDFFAPHRTMLMDLTIPRWVGERVFEFKSRI